MTPAKTGPFQRMVVLGDSIAYGMCAYEASNEWNQVVAALLRKFQDEPLTVFNRALPASVISPRCPGYLQSCKPGLLERYHRHCIDLRPELVVLAQGLNVCVPVCQLRTMWKTSKRLWLTSISKPTP